MDGHQFDPSACPPALHDATDLRLFVPVADMPGTTQINFANRWAWPLVVLGLLCGFGPTITVLLALCWIHWS